MSQEEAKGVNKPMWSWVPNLYMHRWLRITPSYAYSFFLNFSLAPLVAYGVFQYHRS